jgi:penicillin-binding protein-related factor A (putative recombinase)
MKRYKSEKEVQTLIIKFLKSIGCYYIKTIVSNRKGIVDIHGCYQGRYFAIEVKAEDKDFRDVTKLQRYDLRCVNDAGGFGFFANSLEYVELIFNYYMIEL